jgi:hypothetical protein
MQGRAGQCVAMLDNKGEKKLPFFFKDDKNTNSYLPNRFTFFTLRQEATMSNTAQTDKRTIIAVSIT